MSLFKGKRGKYARCIDAKNGCLKRGKTDSFMVSNEVWIAANLKGDDFCCLTCLERRLGRELTKDDFTNAPINDEILWAFSKNILE